MIDFDLKEKLSKLFSKNKKVLIIVLCSIAAVTMIVISELGEKTKTDSPDTVKTNSLDSSYETELEDRLERIITQIDGVGRTSVMVKAASSEKSEFAKDSVSSSDSDGDRKQDSQYVVIKGRNNEEGILLQKNYPEIQGVIVVCQGGADSRVISEVTNAVSSLLGISTNNISVIKMKNSEE